jgi:hypothetical protein
MAEADVIENPFGDYMIDDDDDREMVPSIKKSWWR